MKNLLLIIILLSSFSFAQKEEIDSLINNWHYAASVADSETFFGFMADDAIYLGTDATERWTKKEFYDWSYKYFQRNSAWTLKPLNRFIIIDDENNIAWFDESLDTGMGPCRGSGVLKKINNEWKLIHYNLALTIPNEAISDIKKLLEDLERR